LFCIWETRVQDYQAFADATGRSWEKPSFEQGPTHPAVNVSWDDAKAFCEWLTQKERQEGRLGEGLAYRLPTDAEWSVAVGLTGETGDTPKEKDAKTKDVYPWGNQWPPPNGAGNYGKSLNVDSFENTSPVGSFAANEFGIYDLGGNVWEWCEDFYDGQSGGRVLRGGSWGYYDPGNLLSSNRFFFTPDLRYGSNGFRVVLVAGGSSR
jgi:formylglycine-generating enzyme required for sulfatase activity